MAQSPQYKVYRDKEYVASFKYAGDAAVLVAATHGEVRWGHSHVIWREGSEYISAGESYDAAAELMHSRIDALHQRAFARTYGRA